MVINHNEEGKFTMRHSQSGSPTSPGAWRMEKSACPEVLGCRLSSFPASGVKTSTSYTQRQLDHCSKHDLLTQGQTFRSASNV